MSDLNLPSAMVSEGLTWVGFDTRFDPFLCQVTSSTYRLFDYIVQCALSPSDQVVACGNNQEARSPMYGVHNLAPAWKNGACDTNCQMLVSACLLAHVNYLHNPVPITLTTASAAGGGMNPANVTNKKQEGAYYGPLFNFTFDGPQSPFGCSGTSATALAPPADSPWVPNPRIMERACGGYTWAGQKTCLYCTDPNGADLSSCLSNNNSLFNNLTSNSQVRSCGDLCTYDSTHNAYYDCGASVRGDFHYNNVITVWR